MYDICETELAPDSGIFSDLSNDIVSPPSGMLELKLIYRGVGIMLLGIMLLFWNYAADFGIMLLLFFVITLQIGIMLLFFQK